MAVIILLISLLLLVVGAELLVRGSSAIARRLGVSSFFIGLTIVGMGTSAPELATSVAAALSNVDDIAVGNVVGSNIFNIAVILGMTALIAPIPVTINVVRQEVFIVIAVSLLPLIGWFTGSTLPRWLGACMVLAMIGYLVRGYYAGRRDGAGNAPAVAAPQSEQSVSDGEDIAADNDHDVELRRELATIVETPAIAAHWSRTLATQIVFVIAGLALLVIGSRLLVHASVDIARALGISELVIGLTIVSAGTSAPELVTSVVAAVRRQMDIAVGNILGSNIFNLLGILGITCLVKPQSLQEQTMLLDVPLMILFSIACLPIMTSGSRISRTEGAVMVLVYIAYVVLLLTVAPQWFAG